MQLCLRANYFKPQGIPMRELEVVELLAEEAESLRLKHIEKMEQKEGAKEMGISQSTFQRTLISAHEKISQAIIKGLAIKIEKED